MNGQVMGRNVMWTSFVRFPLDLRLLTVSSRFAIDEKIFNVITMAKLTVLSMRKLFGRQKWNVQVFLVMEPLIKFRLHIFVSKSPLQILSHLFIIIWEYAWNSFGFVESTKDASFNETLSTVSDAKVAKRKRMLIIALSINLFVGRFMKYVIP